MIKLWVSNQVHVNLLPYWWIITLAQIPIDKERIGIVEDPSYYFSLPQAGLVRSQHAHLLHIFSSRLLQFSFLLFFFVPFLLNFLFPVQLPSQPFLFEML